MADQPDISLTVVARLAAAAAREVPDVLELHGGTLGEVATYGHGGPVRGVRVERSPKPRVRMHTVMRFGARMDDVAEELRTQVRAKLAADAPMFADAVIDVHIASVRETEDESAHTSPSSARELS